MVKQIFVIIVTILFLSLISGGVNAQETAKKPANQSVARPAFRMPVAIKSAEILPDNSVIFRLVSKRCRFCICNSRLDAQFGSSVPMVKNDTSLWTLTVGPLKARIV